MKNSLLSGVGLAALFAGQAMAADMPVKAPSGSFSWTGGYVGATAGAAFGQYDARTSTAGSYMDAAQADAVAASGAQTMSPHGFAAGVEAGYNWQIGRWVSSTSAAKYIEISIA